MRTQNCTPECKNNMNGTPEYNNHLQTYDNISKHMMTQNGTPDCRHRLQTQNKTGDPRKKELYQNIPQHKIGPLSARTISKHMTPYQNI